MSFQTRYAPFVFRLLRGLLGPSKSLSPIFSILSALFLQNTRGQVLYSGLSFRRSRPSSGMPTARNSTAFMGLLTVLWKPWGRGAHYPTTISAGSVRLQQWMDKPVSVLAMTEQDRQISQVVAEQRSRLGKFIRRRVPDPSDAEDIVQEVLYELVEANRLLMPIEHVTGWLYRVARNRITDLFRKKKPVAFSDSIVEDESGELLRIEDLLPSPEAGPEALYFRSVLLDEIELALDELPREQRAVFVAHEIEGRSFKELSAESGVSVNTLLSRKRYAVLHLRERLRIIHDELRKE